MKKTLRKITASIAAAVMCALPVANSLTANATASANARYTFRKTFAISEYNGHEENPHDIATFVFGVACRTANTSAPAAHQIGEGKLTPGGGGAPGCYNGGGNFYPTDHNIVGGLVSVHMYCDTPYDYKEMSTTNYAYDSYGNPVNDIVAAGPTFLVGDLDLDKDIDTDDFQILFRGISDRTKDFKESYKFCYFEIMNVAIGGVGRNYSAYPFDINDDGYLSYADVDMFQKYLSNSNYRFEN